MTTRIVYLPGVPCWVETLQADPRSAMAFYSGLFGWDFVGSGVMPNAGGEYYVARVSGADVAGIATLPPGVAPAPAWTTYVRVDDADESAARAKRAGGTVLVAPFDAPPAGRGAVLASPDGAVFGLWQPGEREGAQLVNAPNAWAMSALRTPDVGGATKFYETLFGWRTQVFGSGAGQVTLAQLPGYVGGTEHQPVPRDVVAVMMASGDVSRASWNVDFWVDDADAAASRAKRLGGRIVEPPYNTPMFRQAVLADREGATFSISQLLMQGYAQPRVPLD